jgi:hypothetical protein
VGPGTGLDDVKRRKIWPLQGFEFCPSAGQPVASRYTDCAIQNFAILRINEIRTLEIFNF